MFSSLFRRSSRPVTIATALFGFAPLTFAMGAPLDPSGLWLTKGDASIVRIAPCGSNYCGKIAWMREPNESSGSPKVDHNNKDTSKRNRPMIGLDLLMDMEADADHWKGKVYNPEDGKIYDITFKVADPTGKAANTAELEGCMMRYLCKSETFKRANEIPKGTAVR